jgi:ATP-dependent helicase HrpB
VTSNSLPIYELRDELIASFREHRRLIVEAPTGSGKSTQVPQMLLDSGLVDRGQIVVLQPRRLAARLLAARVAEERGGRPGDEVGFQIRFHDQSGPRTRIKYLTEGILLRQTLSDPALSRVHTLILDEFHERHIYGDVTLGQALRIQQSIRPDLRIVVMSATLDTHALARFLEPCRVLRSAGRTWPVTMEYLPRAPDEKKTPVWDLAAREFERLVREHPEGHVLVFMPGAYEIMRTVQAVRALPAARGMDVLPLHGELAERDQDLAVRRSDQRKVVVATNVAETSITIDNVRVVIDSGLARVPKFDPYRGIDTLLTEKISRASAEQRAGRAGRTAPGQCLRLWTEREHGERPARTAPEIRRLDLCEVVLTLKANAPAPASGAPPPAGPLADIHAFPWVDPPEDRALERAMRLLIDLGAVDGASGAITALGRKLVSFPMHPRFGRMLLAAGGAGCVPTAALIAALTQERNLLLRRTDEIARENRRLKMDAEEESDFFRMIAAWRYAKDREYNVDVCRNMGIHAQTARQVERVWGHFLGIAGDVGLDVRTDSEDRDAVRKCILTAFSDQLARRLGEGVARCAMVHGRKGQVAPESVVRRGDLLVAAEIREVEARKGDLAVWLSLCTAVQRDWLEELFPQDFSRRRVVDYDPAQKRVVARDVTLFRDLALEEKSGAVPPPDDAAALLAREVRAGRLSLVNWNHAAEQWILRVNFLARVCPDLGVPAVTEEDEEHVLAQICHGALSHKEIKERPVLPVLKSWLSAAQRDLVERHAPERLHLPNGRSPKLTYVKDAAPFIDARIQDLYGIEGTMRIAMNRTAVLIRVLAPSHRPVQITDDLSRFWREHYPRVKKELQRKYPKHEWR